MLDTRDVPGHGKWECGIMGEPGQFVFGTDILWFIINMYISRQFLHTSISKYHATSPNVIDHRLFRDRA